MQAVKVEELTLEVEEQTPGLLRVWWTGKSNTREPAKTLKPFFDKVLERAGAARRDIEMHFEKLDHFNSSTIAALIQFINAAQQAGGRTVLVYDPTQRWQTLSFDALRRALKPFENAVRGQVQFVPVTKG